MSVRIYSPNLVWTPLPKRLLDIGSRLEATLRAWEGTPYSSGQRFKQRGADCIGGVFGVVDELDGRERASFPGMPQDTAMHNRETAIAAVKELLRRYSPSIQVPSDERGTVLVQPGDIVVTGCPGGGPGHVEIVGAKPNELWHALPGPGFHQGGMGFLDQQVLFAVYRICDRDRWLTDENS